MYATGKLGATERKLAATEELLRIAKEEIAGLERQLKDSQASYELQAKNTGAFWAAARGAEGKLEAIRGLVEGTRATSRATLATAIREVLDAD